MIQQNRLPQIFVSVGHQLTTEQRYFVDEIDELLRTHGYAPVTIGRTTEAMERPLEAIRDVIAGAQGAIVIAFARLDIQVAIEYPDAPFAQSIPERTLPTVWNQIEAAMAVQAQIPLLLLCEEGLHFEGIIDPLVHLSVVFSGITREKIPKNVSRAVFEWLAEAPWQESLRQTRKVR